MKKNQSGIVILFLLIIALLAMVGFIIWRAVDARLQHKTPKKSNKAKVSIVIDNPYAHIGD